MKCSLVSLWSAAFGLASALGESVIACNEGQHCRPHQSSRPAQHSPKIDTAPVLGQGMTFWNDFSQPINDDTACVVFRGLEWLAYNLIQPTEEITSEAGTRVFVPKSKQGGPLVLNIRSMLIWTNILDKLTVQLEATNVWSLKTQLHVAQCYLDYAFQTAAWLSVLKKQSCDFNAADPASCLMYDKIEALYIAYTHVANLVYGRNTGVPRNVEELITGNFPDTIPTWFKTRFPDPQPGSSISEYIANFDWALPQAGQLFEQNQAAWACTDFAGGVQPGCTTAQKIGENNQAQENGKPKE